MPHPGKLLIWALGPGICVLNRATHSGAVPGAVRGPVAKGCGAAAELVAAHRGPEGARGATLCTRHCNPLYQRRHPYLSYYYRLEALEEQGDEALVAWPPRAEKCAHPVAHECHCGDPQRSTRGLPCHRRVPRNVPDRAVLARAVLAAAVLAPSWRRPAAAPWWLAARASLALSRAGPPRKKSTAPCGRLHAVRGATAMSTGSPW